MLSVSMQVQQLLDNPVTRDKLVALVATAIGTITGTVEGSMIENGAVTEAKIGEGAVTEEKIGEGAVTAAKLAAGSVTAEKLAGSESGILLVRNALCASATGIQASSSAGTWVDATGLSVEITLHSEASKVLVLGALALSGTYSAARIVRDGVPVLQGDADGSRTQSWGGTFRGDGTGVPFVLIETPGSLGPHTYKVQFMTSHGNYEARVNRYKTAQDTDSGYSQCLASSLAIIELYGME